MGRAAEDKGRARPQGRETPPLSGNKNPRVRAGLVSFNRFKSSIDDETSRTLSIGMAFVCSHTFKLQKW
jgi:hypothetical protein